MLDTCVEKHGLLTDVSYLRTEVSQLDILELFVIYPDRAICRVVKPLDQLNDGAFAGAGWANDSGSFTGGKSPRKVFEYTLVRPARVMEVDLVKSYLTLHLMMRGQGVVNLDLWDAVNDIKSLLARSFSRSQALNVGCETTKGNHSKEHSEKD